MNARQTHDRGWEAKCQLLRQVPRGAAAGGAAQQQGVAKAAAAGGGMKDMWLVQLTESRGCCFLINRPAGQVLEAESTSETAETATTSPPVPCVLACLSYGRSRSRGLRGCRPLV